MLLMGLHQDFLDQLDESITVYLEIRKGAAQFPRSLCSSLKFICDSESILVMHRLIMLGELVSAVKLAGDSAGALSYLDKNYQTAVSFIDWIIETGRLQSGLKKYFDFFDCECLKDDAVCFLGIKAWVDAMISAGASIPPSKEDLSVIDMYRI